MNFRHRGLLIPRQFQDLLVAEQPASGTDDYDDRDDEHADENEAPQRKPNENIETPEDFEINDEDDSGRPEDDDADEEEDEDEMGTPPVSTDRLIRTH